MCTTDSEQPASKRQKVVLDDESNSTCGVSPENKSPELHDDEQDTETETETDSDASSVNYQDEAFGCWQTLCKISSGNNGQVYVARLMDKNLELHVALKVETRSIRHSHLKNEVEVMNLLRDVQGVPKVWDTGIAKDRHWMVMDLLGPSLRTLFDRYTFDEDLTVFLADQMLTRLEALHSKGYVHLSVKPDNYCLQIDDKGEVVVNMIDYGRCERYVSRDGRHITFGKNKGGPYSRWYHSGNALRGMKQSRRDDLESLAYSLVYFFKGERFIDWKEGLPVPADANVYEHYKESLPTWLLTFMKHILSLGWDQTPDYALLHRLIYSRFTAEGVTAVSDFLNYAVRRHFQRMGPV